MGELSVVQQVAIAILPIMFAVTVHEAAHAWAAFRLGDPTAREMGRLTFNPIKHIDPVGTVVLPVALLALGGVIFGWAKPVPVDWRRLHRPRRDMALVALAGPTANLVMALLWAGVIKLGVTLGGESGGVMLFVILTGLFGIQINVILLILNLLPIPPLDGGRILHSLLPPQAARAYAALEPYGLIIVLLLLVSGLLGKILLPPMDWLVNMIFDLIV